MLCRHRSTAARGNALAVELQRGQCNADYLGHSVDGLAGAWSCALGAKVDEPDEKGCTPLYIACTMGHAHVVLALGRLGADPNQPSNRGVTPLEACEMYGHDRAADAVRSLMAVAR